jgi:type II secretory pathway pseudopilin PulG
VIFLLVAVVLLGAVALGAINKSRQANAKVRMELQAAQQAAQEEARKAREAMEAKARVEREAQEAKERAIEERRLAELARWKFVGSTEFVNIYANLTSRRRSGDVITMWTILDIKTPVELEVGWFASSLVMNEFDCRYGAQRTVLTSMYSGHMASGDAVSSDKDISAWTMPKLGTIEGELWKIACNQQ